ncbi:MAG: phosphoribosylformimino-5-aminoimidazole carboxamide ribotide isomerase [Proteobacteria bacterium]|nr:phosphoribosylformimino-5-aminoimidazole carboxamide ribotide isomerase [Pseudomonadota bacterium]MBU1716042.1 phosphoribosylformimino-5-aminoimidazole carboxamide ribotide isomerase [Pseudomonadota bacterium]
MKFRPCIDLHDGTVKQIVGSTLSGNGEGLTTNFASEHPSSYYARMYKHDGLDGGHVIMLGAGNEEAALAALQSYPGGLQIGGGITGENAGYWLDAGAGAIIVTSYVFKDGQIYEERLQSLADLVGRDKLVIDLSCRKKDDSYYVVTDRWQKFTSVKISRESLEYFSRYCCEFLIHAADVEGKCAGIDDQLVADLASWSPIETTYAGGVKNLADLYKVKELGLGRLDVTIGSALDIFGGKGIKYTEAVAFNRLQD